jgi:rRNA maturation protein Nop10
MVTLGELLGVKRDATIKTQVEMAGRPTLKKCETCGEEYYLSHPGNKCQSVKDQTKNAEIKKKDKNGKRR